MTAKPTCGGELSKFMTHHIFSNVDRNELITIMNSNGMSHKIRGNH